MSFSNVMARPRSIVEKTELVIGALFTHSSCTVGCRKNARRTAFAVVNNVENQQSTTPVIFHAAVAKRCRGKITI